MPFASLLGLGSLQPAAVRAHDLALLPYVRRVDGSLSQAGLTHLDMAGELARLVAAALLARLGGRLRRGIKVVISPSSPAGG